MVGLPCVPAAGSSGGKAGDGDDEEQLLAVPGLLVRVNFRGTSSG